VLRHISWPLVREYFSKRPLLDDLACLQQDEADVDALAVALQGLPAAQRTEVDQDLQDLYELSDGDGMQLIWEEAHFRSDDLSEVFTNLDGPYDAAMWTLCSREALFAEVLRFRTADTLNARYWRRRRGILKAKPDTSDAGLKLLSRQLTDYLVQREGRGQHCHIEYLCRSTGHLFIAYPEDYGQTVLEYDDDKLVRRKIRPATDLLFFHAPERGTLEIFCQGARDKVRDLQEIFARAILGIVLGPDPAAEKAYRLNLLKQADFSFVIDPTTGLENIEVKWLHLRDREGGRQLILQVGGPAGRGVVFAAEKYFATNPGDATDRYPLALLDVHKAKLQAAFRPLGNKRRGQTKTFTLTLSGCLLDQEGIDGVIRKAMEDSGLEQPALNLVFA
jgi:hypothetical protein